jgi:hypothetical protein
MSLAPLFSAHSSLCVFRSFPGEYFLVTRADASDMLGPPRITSINPHHDCLPGDMRIRNLLIKCTPITKQYISYSDSSVM